MCTLENLPFGVTCFKTLGRVKRVPFYAILISGILVAIIFVVNRL